MNEEIAPAQSVRAKRQDVPTPAPPAVVAPNTERHDPAPDRAPDRANDGTAPEGGAIKGAVAGGTGSGAARPRRRRGGRGRGRGGAGRPAAASPEADADVTGSATDRGAPVTSEAAPTKAPDDQAAPRQRQQRAPSGQPRQPRQPRESAPTQDSPSGSEITDPTTTGTPRKRRRRGGRGRGRKPSGATTASADQEVEAGADDEAPLDGPATQRDDATPDAPVAGANGGRRRRRSAVTEPAAAKTKPAKRMSVEEQVASGGPTRSLRNSRGRTGREGGRRRREPLIVPPRVTDKLMVITEHGDRDQIAVLEADVLVQHYVTRTGARSMVGCVYLGRVQNVLPGMEAAFVDIGRGRNGVLYAGEVNYRPEDLEGPAPRIEQVLKNGQAVMVQVTKDPMGGKGARLTAQISMPGRYLVLAPDQSLSGISRRLPEEERKRLKSILKKIKPAEHGVIVRTAAEGASEEALTRDLQRLVREWDDIQKLAKKVKAPDVLYEEPELTVRVVRDLFTDEEFKGLVTDSSRVYDKIMTYVRDIAPDLESKITLHTGKLPAFEEYRIVEQIHKALDKKVWLPSGGYLFIERTEAMAIVDVNTGKSVGKTNLEETVVNTNLEAAKETARQLRLRDIGGIIVIDFIDMLLEKHKKQVEDTMREALAADKTRSQVFGIGPLGLMQVTRKRVSGGLVESFSETCPTCEGRGILINYEG
jgi:ribonuclease E